MAKFVIWLLIFGILYLWAAALFGQQIAQMRKRRREALEAETAEINGGVFDPTGKDGRGSDFPFAGR
jgi:hypothetical protein